MNEEIVCIENYENFQIEKLNYLIEKNYIFVDEKNLIRFSNEIRVHILRDLYENEVASFYHYPDFAQEETVKMFHEELVSFDSSLFSKPEQDYFNFGNPPAN